jgi:hypothetical protein
MLGEVNYEQRMGDSQDAHIEVILYAQQSTRHKTGASETQSTSGLSYLPVVPVEP